MVAPKAGPSVSSAALEALLGEATLEAEAIKTRFHRTMLWRLRAGRRSPDLQTAIELEKLSGGRVTAAGWEVIKHGASEPDKGAA